MGLFGRRKKEEETAETPATVSSTSGDTSEPAPESQYDSPEEQAVQTETATDPFAARTSGVFADSLPLEAGSGLHRIVRLMREKGEGQTTLSLKQDGDDMQLRLYNNGEEAESIVVTPESNWFAPVASLYTEEKGSERGEWNRALIVVNPSVGEDAAVQASFLNTNDRTSHNLKYVVSLDSLEVLPAQRLVRASSAPGEDAVSGQESLPVEVAESVGEIVLAEPEADLAEEVSPTVVAEEAAETATVLEEDEDSAYVLQKVHHSSQGEHHASQDAAQVPITGVNQLLTAEQIEAYKVSRTKDGAVKPGEVDSVESGEQEGAAEVRVAAPVASVSPSLAPAFNPGHEQAAGRSEQRGAEVAAESVEAEVEDAGVLDAPAAGVLEPLGVWQAGRDAWGTAPSTASTPDVSSTPRQLPDRPSREKLADGNLVLTEAEVVSRLQPAYDALFGAEGSALEATTVLVRIRALGSYYDALTHVRSAGEWKQERTFDLIPEEVLQALSLKVDSYREGKGSPVAMSLRFTPGVPPLASFDYLNEEAFVSYSDGLPAQHYIEELRMFPRTGANIPAHMSEALASWAF